MFRILILVIMVIFSFSGKAQIAHNVELLDQWTNDTLIKNNDGTIFNGCWGFAYNGDEYAVIGSTRGTHIFQITSGNKLKEVDYIPGTSVHSTSSNNIHREFKTYKNYLYGVCDEGFSTLQIMDMSTLPDSVTLVSNDDEFFFRAHDLWIDSAEATMYVCGPRDTSGLWGLMSFSIADPVNPVKLYTYTDTWYVHGAFVRNDTAWFNCAGEGLKIYKFDNGANPVLLNYMDFYPDQGYNHSGWLSEDSKYYVFTDETQGKKIKLCDVSDITDINIIETFWSESNANTIAHVVMWKNDYVYSSYYYDGLQVFDARDKTNVKRVAWYDTRTIADGDYQGAWGIWSFYKDNKVIISDRNTGLYLFKVNLPPDINTDILHGVYPNPASDNVYFYYDNETPLTFSFKVFDAVGKLVYQKNAISSNFHQFNVKDWSAGSYFYQWEGEGNDVLLSGKFVVTK